MFSSGHVRQVYVFDTKSSFGLQGKLGSVNTDNASATVYSCQAQNGAVLGRYDAVLKMIGRGVTSKPFVIETAGTSC